MSNTLLFDNGQHRNILLEDSSRDNAVQANQHLIIHENAGMILDPGGHKVYGPVMSRTMRLLDNGKLHSIFLSHQDPDVIAAVNGWLMTTDAVAYISSLWLRFVPHFGLDNLVLHRLHPIPDQGMFLELNGAQFAVIPAHFLHSPGNFQLYDPVSKILYSGDLGASLGMEYIDVTNFEKHIQYMEGFHRRYMASNRSMRGWAAMVRNLDIDMIAPQHGALFCGKEMVNKFISWCEGLECGVDLADQIYQLPVA